VGYSAETGPAVHLTDPGEPVRFSPDPTLNTVIDEAFGAGIRALDRAIAALEVSILHLREIGRN